MRPTLHERIQSGSHAVATDQAEGDRCVVMCPPHPQYGGNKNDSRLTATAEALNRRGLSALRFDYGDWTGGEGETRDAVHAVEHAHEGWSHVGLFGYSFGAGIAAKASQKTNVTALGLLAPPPEAAEHLPDTPTYVIAGTNDTTLDSSQVAEQAEDSRWVNANHFFTGAIDEVAEKFADFFDSSLT